MVLTDDWVIEYSYSAVHVSDVQLIIVAVHTGDILAVIVVLIHRLHRVSQR